MATAGLLWLFWRQVLGSSLQREVKNYYLSDQLAYLAITTNVRNGQPAYVEPYTMTGDSLYPSGYYWFLGVFGRLTGVGPLGAWNVVGMMCTLGLAAAVGLLARELFRTRWAWSAGPLALSLGNLQWYETSTWFTTAGPSHAVLWPPLGVLFNPGAETPALAAVILALVALLRALAQERLDLRSLIVAGGLLGLVLNLQTYVALFGLTIVCVLLPVSQVLRKHDRTLVLLLVVVPASVLVCFAVGGAATPLAMLLALLTAFLAPVFVLRGPRGRLGVPIVVLGAAAAGAASPVLARTIAQALDPQSFFYLRQQWASDQDLALPAGPVIMQTSPVLLGAGLMLWCLCRRRSQEADLRAAGLVSVLVASGLLIFNGAWGMEQEPYRFHPYGALLIAAFVVAWILGDFSSRRPAAAVAALLLAATAPTTVDFARDTGRTPNRVVAPGERLAYAELGHVVGSQATLLDSCLPHQIVKIMSGARIADFNRGLAVPALLPETLELVEKRAVGAVPSARAFRAAGVRFYVSFSRCRGLTQTQVDARFGDPVARIPLSDAITCGFPSSAQLVVYRADVDRPGVPAGRTLAAPGWQAADRYLPGDDGTLPVLPTRSCSIGA